MELWVWGGGGGREGARRGTGVRSGNGYGYHTFTSYEGNQANEAPPFPFPVHSLIHFISTLSHSLTLSHYSHPNSESDSNGQEIPSSQPALEEKKTVDGGIRVHGG